MRNYIIKVWETEDEREQGLSDILEVGIEKIDIAIEKAKEIKDNNNYACIEVQDSKEQNTYYSNDGKIDTIYEQEYKQAKEQENLNHLYSLMYENRQYAYIDESIVGKAEFVLKELEENKKNIIEEYDEETDILEKEYEELLEDVKQYDKDDIVSVYEHPMAVTPMLAGYRKTLEILGTEFLNKLENDEITEYEIEDIVLAYMGSNEIQDFMDYGSDRDSYNMITFTSVYEYILDLLKIDYENIYTNEIRGGKYETVIEFANNNSITVDTYSRNGQQHITENMQSIKEFANELEQIEDDEMEM